MLTRSQYEARLRDIRLLATDVDGVLTDGSIVYVANESEAKVFHVRDGSAAHIARLVGIPVLVITARNSAAVARRFAELPVHALRQGAFDKVSACSEIQAELGVGMEQTAYIGDDLVDLPLLRRVGLSIAVADAHPRLIEAVDWRTGARGGHGAFREVVDDLVSARDLWADVVADYERRQGLT